MGKVCADVGSATTACGAPVPRVSVHSPSRITIAARAGNPSRGGSRLARSLLAPNGTTARMGPKVYLCS